MREHGPVGLFGRSKRVKAQAVSDADALRAIAADGKPVLVDVWRSNCVPCKTMDGIVDELAAEYDGSAHVVKVDAGRAPEIVQAFRVMSTPTFLVLSGKGAERLRPRWRHSGLIKKDQLARVLEREGAVRLAD